MTSLSKGYHLSSSLKEEVMMVNNHNQGIVSILGLDSDEMTKTPSSLRRTLSADMSSKQWQLQHGFNPLKKIASSEELSLSITNPSLGEKEETFQYSSTHQEEKKQQQQQEQQQQQQVDIWSLIISQKEKEDPNNLPPQYIHPLVKRSASSLSEKSLEICTESLGSETGSDGYSSYQPSEGEADQEEREQVLGAEKLVQEYNDFPMTKYRKFQQQPIRCFPPPITSLASNRDGVSLQMKSRRDNGRLVLDAVSITSQKNFSCQRQDGRLVLSFINNPPAGEEDDDEEEEEEEEEDSDEQFEVEIENGEAKREEVDKEVIEEDDDEEEEEEEEAEEEAEIYKAEVLPSGVISVHRLALMMNKKVLANNKYNEVVKMGLEGGEEEEEMVVERISINPVLTRSLPPRTPYSQSTKAAASCNAYECYWKQKSIIPPKVPGFGSITHKQTFFLNDKYSNNDNNKNNLILSKNYMVKERREVLLLRGNKGDYLVKGCKEPRKSLLVWEPHCIATT